MTLHADSSPVVAVPVAERRSSPSDAQPRFNIVILGATRAGKTQLVARHRYGIYSANHLPTHGIEYAGWSVRDRTMRLGVWDTGGNERYRSIAYPHVCEAHVLVYVFDVNDRTSFERLNALADSLAPMAAKAVVRVLVATKIDVGRRCIDDAHIEAFKQRLHIDAFYPVSARTGAGVECVFAGIEQLLRASGAAPLARPNPAEMTRRRRSPAKRVGSSAMTSLKALATSMTCSMCAACTGASRE